VDPAFLLDEHISRRVAEAARQKGVNASAVDGSPLAGTDDFSLLRIAVGERRILVTYNNADLAPLYADLARETRDLPGIVFVDGATIPTSDIGGLAKSLAKLDRLIRSGKVSVEGGVFLTRT